MTMRNLQSVLDSRDKAAAGDDEVSFPNSVPGMHRELIGITISCLAQNNHTIF